MRKTGENAENRAPGAKHHGATQPGRPEFWHGLAVLGGTAVPHGTARAMPAVGIFRLFNPFLLHFSGRLRVGFLPRLFPHQIQGSLRENLG